MTQNGLVNCKKCGTLFVKNSRDICDNCFRAEMNLVDSIKSFLLKSDKRLTVEDISFGLNIKKTDLEELFEKGRLFSVMSKLLIKCKVCGIEMQDDSKSGFVCQKCIQKFNPTARSNAQGDEDANAKKERKRINPGSKKNRYDFIQSYDF